MLPSSTVIVCKPVHPANGFVPIEVTDAGMVIVSSLVHPAKACAAITSTLPGIAYVESVFPAG